MKKYKENHKLIWQNLDFENYRNEDIVNLIELSYILSKNDKVKELDEIICEYSYDGINTYGTFIKFFYESYMKNMNWDLWEMATDDEEVEKLVNKFIEIYFEEVK